MTFVFFVICSIALFVNFKNIWVNIVKLVLALAVTLNGIQGIMRYASASKAIIMKDFYSRPQLTIDERGMMEICSETVGILGKVVYHMPTVLCAVLLYIMIKVLIRRSFMRRPHASVLTVNLTLLFMLFFPLYCAVAYGLGLHNPIYNMMPLMLTLAVYVMQSMVLPLTVFVMLCTEAERYFSENTATKYKEST